MGKNKSPSPGPVGKSGPGRRHSAESKKKSSGLGGGWLKTALAIFVLPVVGAIAGWYFHQHYIYLPSLVNTPSPLARVVPESTYKEDHERFWGTYRSNLYFGMRARTPNSPVVGLMWYEQPRANEILMPKIRYVYIVLDSL